MKKTLIIITGIVLILIVLGVWMYLLFFGTPENNGDLFANLGFGGNTETPTVVEQPITTETPALPIDTSQALRQLTTLPVAGFGFIGTGTSDIRYVERGTGHIFAINLATGYEDRVSGTTVPQVVEAVFNRDADIVVLTSESNNALTLLAGTIPEVETSIDYLTLPIGAFEPGFVANDLYYLVATDIGADGYQLDITDNDPDRIFSLPFGQITPIWSTGSDVLVYNQPSATLPGALYDVTPRPTPVTPQAFGLMAGSNDRYYLISKHVDGAIKSTAIDRTTDQSLDLAVNFIPEKCSSVAGNSNQLWCAVPFDGLRSNFTEAWYKGLINSNDVLWQIDIAGGSASLIENFAATAGRVIDVDGIHASFDGRVVLFRNKLDGTLWLYDTRI